MFIYMSLLFLITLFANDAFAINSQNTGYKIKRAAQEVFYNNGKNCVRGYTTGGFDVFAPTRTGDEARAFIRNKPSNVKLTDCLCRSNGKGGGCGGKK